MFTFLILRQKPLPKGFIIEYDRNGRFRIIRDIEGQRLIGQNVGYRGIAEYKDKTGTYFAVSEYYTGSLFNPNVIYKFEEVK